MRNDACGFEVQDNSLVIGNRRCFTFDKVLRERGGVTEFATRGLCRFVGKVLFRCFENKTDRDPHFAWYSIATFMIEGVQF